MLATEQFELERLSERDYRLHWPIAAGGQVAAIAAGDAPTASTVTAAVDNAAGCADIRGLEPAARHFFHVHFADGRQLLLAERRLALYGAPNFRDFGGYTACDGRRVRWGVLYRSGHLNQLNDDDLAITAALDIGLVCDFRERNESECTPNRYAPHYRPRVESLPIMPGSAANVLAELSGNHAAAAEDVVRAMIAINRDLALAQQDAYRRLLHLLAAHNNGVLIHCAVGKDRTGFGAALILAALGVPEETLLYDYLLTAKYLPIERELDIVREKYRLDLPDAALRPMLEVRHEYLRAAFDAVRDEYGTLDHYLRDALHVDAAMQHELRARLLES